MQAPPRTCEKLLEVGQGNLGATLAVEDHELTTKIFAARISGVR